MGDVTVLQLLKCNHFESLFIDFTVSNNLTNSTWMKKKPITQDTTSKIVKQERQKNTVTNLANQAKRKKYS